MQTIEKFCVQTSVSLGNPEADDSTGRRRTTKCEQTAHVIGVGHMSAKYTGRQ